VTAELGRLRKVRNATDQIVHDIADGELFFVDVGSVGPTGYCGHRGLAARFKDLFSVTGATDK
jgi:hypothetical protein